MRPFCMNCVKAYGNKVKRTVNGAVINVKSPKTLKCHNGGKEMLEVEPDFTCGDFTPITPEEPTNEVQP